MKILIINGKPRSGKSIFCDTIRQRKGLIYSYSTIDEVKKLARQLGWDGKKDEKGRKFLSDLKDAMTEYNDLPHQYILNEIQKHCEKYKDTPEIINNLIFLVQSREPDDIERWQAENNAKAILVRREGFLDDHIWSNHADDEVYDCAYDYVIDNIDSLEEWKETSVWFIEQIRREKWESHI